MRKILSLEILLFLSRFILAGVFILSGIEKVSDVSSFSSILTNYKIFPSWSVNLIAITLPWIELINGILLLYGYKKKEIALIFGIVLIFFIVLIFISILRGLDINCGCFGTIGSVKIGFIKIYENIILVLLTLHILFFSKNN